MCLAPQFPSPFFLSRKRTNQEEEQSSDDDDDDDEFLNFAAQAKTKNACRLHVLERSKMNVKATHVLPFFGFLISSTFSTKKETLSRSCEDTCHTFLDLSLSFLNRQAT